MSKIFRNALFETKERESAVSPVVGVMLMLVVTIIIAATVSAFAGGLVGTADKAPQAAFDVKINIAHQSWATERTMTFTHLGGDPIDTGRTKLVTSWTNKTTKEVCYSEVTALPESTEEAEYNSKTHDTAKLNLVTANCNYSSLDFDDGNTYDFKYQEPYFVLPGTNPTDHGAGTSLWYGNYILHPGDVMKVQMSLYEDAYVHPYKCGKDNAVIKEYGLLSGKDVVNVKLIDIPTGQIIYDKDIYVVEA